MRAPRIKGAYGQLDALPDVKERLATQELEAVANSPEQALDYMRAEIGKWSKVARNLGLRAD